MLSLIHIFHRCAGGRHEAGIGEGVGQCAFQILDRSIGALFDLAPAGPDTQGDKEEVGEDVYKRQVCKNKCKIWDALILFGMMLLNEVLVFGVYGLFWMPAVFKEALRIICISVFYFGAAYFLTFLTRSLTAPLMALLLYTIANTIWMNQKFPLYCTLQFLRCV